MDVFSFPIVCLAETFWNLIIYDARMGFELKDPQIIQYYTHKSRTNVKLHIYNNCKYVVYIYNSFARFKFVSLLAFQSFVLACIPTITCKFIDFVVSCGVVPRECFRFSAGEFLHVFGL